MFQKRTLIIVFVIVALGLGFGTFFFRSNLIKPEKKVEASSVDSTITTQAQWDDGNKDNIDSTTSPGSIKINILCGGTLATGNGVVTVSGAGDSSYNGTYNEIGSYNTHPSFTNGSRWLYVGESGVWALSTAPHPGPCGEAYNAGSCLPSNPWHIEACQSPPEYVVPAPAPTITVDTSISGAIHTTAPTQIDGGANFWQWETFTDSKTVPANTSVAYRYRTSSNGTDWTSWVGSIGSVTSRTGDDSNNPTKYRYLQVEATLSNTDGASTPTIDSYTIGYHTEQKPNKPTAQTAVVQ